MNIVILLPLDFQDHPLLAEVVFDLIAKPLEVGAEECERPE